MNSYALSQSDKKRLERLAQAAGRTPRALLRHVLRDGFVETERTIMAVRARMKSGKLLEHSQAMRQLDELCANGASKQAA